MNNNFIKNKDKVMNFLILRPAPEIINLNQEFLLYSIYLKIDDIKTLSRNIFGQTQISYLADNVNFVETSPFELKETQNRVEYAKGITDLEDYKTDSIVHIFPEILKMPKSQIDFYFSDNDLSILRQIYKF